MGARAPSKSWMTAEPQVVCPKMVPIFSFAQCEWATFGVRSGPEQGRGYCPDLGRSPPLLFESPPRCSGVFQLDGGLDVRGGPLQDELGFSPDLAAQNLAVIRASGGRPVCKQRQRPVSSLVFSEGEFGRVLRKYFELHPGNYYFSFMNFMPYKIKNPHNPKLFSIK